MKLHQKLLLSTAFVSVCGLSAAIDAKAQQVINAGDTYTVSTDGLIGDSTNVQADGTLNIDQSDTIGALTGSGTVDISTGQTLTTNGPPQYTIYSGSITGDGNFTKSGSDTLQISGSNTYTGATTVSAGTLVLSGSNQSTAYQINSGATLDNGANGILDTASIINNGVYKTATSTINSLSGSGDIEIFSSDTLSVGANNSSIIFNGNITQESNNSYEKCNLIKMGTGTLTLTGDFTCKGTLSVAEGTLSFDGSTSSNYTMVAIEVDNGAILSFDGSNAFNTTLNINAGGIANVNVATAVDNLTGSGELNLNGENFFISSSDSTLFSGTISGSGGIRRNDSGTLTLSGNNTYTGSTNINGGAIALSGSNASTSYTVASGATLQALAGVDISDTASLDIAGTFDVDASDTVGSVTGAGSIDIATGQTLTTGDANTDTTFSGVISGDGALTKSGTGTFTLSGNNTYTGDTTVSGGTLDVTGTLTGTTNVNSGGILKGIGTLADVTVLSGGTLAPGASIGTINTGNLTLNSGSTLEIEVDDAGNSDLVNVTGTVSLGGSTLDINGAAGTYTNAPIDYTIITNDGADAVTGTFGTITDDLAFLEASVDYTGGDGNDVVLTLSELTSFVMAGSNQNQQSVGQALGNIDRTSGGEGEALIQQILNLTDAQARATQSDLSGDLHPTSSRNMMDVGGNVASHIGGRLAGITGRGGQNGGAMGNQAAFDALDSNSFTSNYFATDTSIRLVERTFELVDPSSKKTAPEPTSVAEQFQFWGGASGYYSRMNGDGNVSGSVSSGFGVTIGGDVTFDNGHSGANTWGAAFGFAQTKTSDFDAASELDVDSYSAAIYAQQSFETFQLNGLAAYTNHQIEGRRTIANINDTASSDYSGHQFTVQGEISRAFDVTKEVRLTPFALGRYMNLSTTPYTETGAGAANLISNGENYQSLDLVLGTRVAFELTDDMNLSLGGGYSHRFGDETPEAAFTLAGGGSFTSQGATSNRHGAFLELDFEKTFDNDAVLFANLASNLSDTDQTVEGIVGFKLQF